MELDIGDLNEDAYKANEINLSSDDESVLQIKDVSERKISTPVDIHEPKSKVSSMKLFKLNSPDYKIVQDIAKKSNDIVMKHKKANSKKKKYLEESTKTINRFSKRLSAISQL